MIQIRKDESYLSELDIKAIESGIAEMGVYSLRITGFFTDEEKEENVRSSKILTNEEWNKRRDQNRKSLAIKVEKIIDKINEKCVIYQYKNETIDYSRDNWDLFFWCNNGDMSYVTLNPNTKRTNEQHLKTIQDVLESIQGVNEEGIEIVIQYKAIYDENKIKEIVLDYCEKMQDKFIEYGSCIGKIIKQGNEFYFKKKGAKKYGYSINNNQILKNILFA